jgi:hypothetical protein
MLRILKFDEDFAE